MSLDAIVVGGSYAGLSAAMQLARARRTVLVVDSGRPRNRFAAVGHGFFAQDGKPPFEILRSASEQLTVYPTVRIVHGEVATVENAGDGFSVVLADGAQAHAARLVLATGMRDELPPISGMEERWGRSVLQCPYCHGYEVADHPLGVIANHPMSGHQALLIPDWGPTTYFTQGTFEPSPEEAAQLAVRRVRIERVPVVELLGPTPALEAVRLADERVLPMHAVFTAPVSHMASPLAEALGCAFDQGPLGAFIRTDDWKRTTVEGVYAAGDAASPFQNASLAAASGVMAGVGAHQSLALK